MIWYLIKIFSEEQFADEFIAGNLYLNRLAYFIALESDCDNGRPDENEAIATWWQPFDIIMKLSVPGVGEVEITKDDLAGPVSTRFDFHDHLHIFCMYAVQTSGFDFIDGKIRGNEADAEKLRQQLKIDDRCLKLGKFAVVVPAVPFRDQLMAGLKGRYKARARSVKYYDETTFHGEIKPEDIPFSKQKRFEFQREYRICINTGTTDDSPLRVNIGDLSHISAKMESSRLNDIFKIKVEPVP